MTESMAEEWEKWLAQEKSNIEIVEERLEELSYKLQNTANFQYRDFWDKAEDIPQIIESLTPLPPDDRQRLLQEYESICNEMKKKQQREWQARKDQSTQNRQSVEQKIERARELAESAPEDMKTITKAQRLLKEAHILLKSNDGQSDSESDDQPSVVLMREDRRVCWEKWHQLNDFIYNSRLTIWDSNYKLLQPQVVAALEESKDGNPHQALEKVKQTQQHMKGRSLNKNQQDEIKGMLNDAWNRAIYKINEIREEKRQKYEQWLGRMEGQFEELTGQFNRNQDSISKLQSEVDQFKEAIQSIRSREYGDKLREEIAKKRERMKELAVVGRQLEGKIESLKNRLEDQSNEMPSSRLRRRPSLPKANTDSVENKQTTLNDSNLIPQEVEEMRIKWLGHASFLITADDGTRIITDPYGSFDGLLYDPIDESADIVTISHSHGDHYGGKVSGNPEELASAGTTTVKGIEFMGIATHHDQSEGKERGNNIAFCFSIDGIRFCHLGDLGHTLSDQQVSEIGEVDILMIPVGGYFTIDAREATQVCNQIRPRIIIPMHVRNQKCAFPISDVENFIQDKSNIQTIGNSEINISVKDLPSDTKVMVLEHAK